MLLGLIGSIALIALAGCGSDSPSLTIDAASSLEPAFTELIEAFIDEPGTDRAGLIVELNAAGSSTLATGIIEGNRPDVFAAADRDTMDRIVDAGRAEAPVLFTRNRLALVTPSDDPADLVTADPSDLPGQLTAASIAQCSPQVPCGRLAGEAQKMLGLQIEPATEETNVRSVLSKVETGEVDAGFVYLTDAITSDVQIIDLEGLDTFVNPYLIVRLEEAANPALAQEFIDFVLSMPGQEILARWGFLAP